MNLSISPPPFAGAPVVVLSAGLGGSGSYWLPQLADLEQDYQVVCYDQRGTGNNPGELPEDYSLAQMADELWQALSTAGIGRFSVVGHALGALIGLQLALDRPGAIDALVCVNGWLTLHPHTRRCFQVRERLLHAGGAQAWVEAQPLFLYPADWMAARQPRMEAEEALALAHFQGKATLLRRLNALKRADFSRLATEIRCPVLTICSADDLLVPAVCSSQLHAALPDSTLTVMPRGGHACNVTEPEVFNALLQNGLASLLHRHERLSKELP
ncbi:pyrimidine utilization protein D [Leclercia adecarboxylata]|jgi:aminoacrylate hydrolase|uniref:Putative carbamate hydrolase RutD n=1 Tax=Leclercia adecarboxylata TaxID=83655 RepID=A0A9X3YD37_9ENTR|nr:pyrimidine utilization protein D [Leclercia adecarboxylata]MBD1404723.1 pyrimidine utilization protein D [Leclercia adecarboxylata]MDC6624520.1 pyrimidine utilization protein D [Leclercia adecarboxylata]MDC6635355.1 pyrimidine utilization protein D [Leclercia adecarboxylata]MDC6640288.1 pyrimidine utilization protein D [Leclercia adecarboxylata]MDC6651075.1 pyrimidine utilization protein D [Leclercia adecarboxylata]